MRCYLQITLCCISKSSRCPGPLRITCFCITLIASCEIPLSVTAIKETLPVWAIKVKQAHCETAIDIVRFELLYYFAHRQAGLNPIGIARRMGQDLPNFYVANFQPICFTRSHTCCINPVAEFSG